MEKALVFHIKRCAFEDGPGIRTNIFLKGCPLRCKWCCNPEGQETYPELSEDAKTEEFFEKYMTVDEVMDIILEDKVFYETSGGGVTIAGGEPTMHYEFVHELLGRCREEGIHTALDTCGWAKGKNAELLMEADMLLYDIKIVDEKQHIEHTGITNGPILENFRKVAGAGQRIVVRVPLIPEHTTDEANIKAIGELLSQYSSVERVDLIPFHIYGMSKYEVLGKPHYFDKIPPISPERVKEIKAELESYGLNVQL